MIMGKDIRLFEKIESENISIKISEVINSNEVTHLNYKILIQSNKLL